MARSVAIIGAGQIGFAAARAFWMAGHKVRLLKQTDDVRWWLDVSVERYVAGDDPPPKADVVVDTTAFDSSDIERYDPDQVGRLILISSASVYCDEQGRTLDEAAQNGFPDFLHPLSEDQLTVVSGPDTYSTRKIRMEEAARHAFGERVTILRPCAIHGLWSRHLREWWFAKRLIDGRTNIPLANRGMGRFHTTSAKTIGQFSLFAGESDLDGTFNIADANAPSVQEIGASIAAMWDLQPEFVPLDGYPKNGVGRTPWSVPAPFIVSTAKAEERGFTGFEAYADTMPEAVYALRDTPPHDWRSAFPQLAAYPWDLFDYAAEDAYLEAL